MRVPSPPQRSNRGSQPSNSGYRRQQRQTRPTSRFEPEEGTENFNRADLSKLKLPSLKKYVRVHDVLGVGQYAGREELLAAVSRHFNLEEVDEKTVLDGLIQSLKKRNSSQ